jgi:hypothetical protein
MNGATTALELYRERAAYMSPEKALANIGAWQPKKFAG